MGYTIESLIDLIHTYKQRQNYNIIITYYNGGNININIIIFIITRVQENYFLCQVNDIWFHTRSARRTQRPPMQVVRAQPRVRDDSPARTLPPVQCNNLLPSWWVDKVIELDIQAPEATLYLACSLRGTNEFIYKEPEIVGKPVNVPYGFDEMLPLIVPGPAPVGWGVWNI